MSHVSITALLVAILAVWRLTHLLSAEDGPGDVLVRFRRMMGSGFFGQLLDCFYCLSLWIAAPLAWLLAASWVERAMLWLALSGGAILLERATTRTSTGTGALAEAPPAIWHEQPLKNDNPPKAEEENFSNVLLR